MAWSADMRANGFLARQHRESAVTITEHSLRSTLQTINGRKVTGCFGWFEPSRKGLLNCFGVVLKSEPGGDMFELDSIARRRVQSLPIVILFDELFDVRS